MFVVFSCLISYASSGNNVYGQSNRAQNLECSICHKLEENEKHYKLYKELDTKVFITS